MNVNLELAVAQFLELGLRLKSLSSVTGERVLDELVSWYQSVRVDGASVGDMNDMLLLEWGGTQFLWNAVKPLDLRHAPEEGITFLDKHINHLGFTRQVFVTSDDPDIDFDESAIQMRVTLYFDSAPHNASSENQWIHKPDQAAAVIRAYRKKPFVEQYLKMPSKQVSAVVDFCG